MVRGRGVERRSPEYEAFIAGVADRIEEMLEKKPETEYRLSTLMHRYRRRYDDQPESVAGLLHFGAQFFEAIDRLEYENRIAREDGRLRYDGT